MKSIWLNATTGKGASSRVVLLFSLTCRAEEASTRRHDCEAVIRAVALAVHPMPKSPLAGCLTRIFGKDLRAAMLSPSPIAERIVAPHEYRFGGNCDICCGKIQRYVGKREIPDAPGIFRNGYPSSLVDVGLTRRRAALRPAFQNADEVTPLGLPVRLTVWFNFDRNRCRSGIDCTVKKFLLAGAKMRLPAPHSFLTFRTVPLAARSMMTRATRKFYGRRAGAAIHHRFGASHDGIEPCRPKRPDRAR